MNIPELEDELVEILENSIDPDQVAEALTAFLEHDKKLNGPEVIDCAATILAATVRTCPSREVALKLFLKRLTAMLSGVGAHVVVVPHVDETTSR